LLNWFDWISNQVALELKPVAARSDIPPGSLAGHTVVLTGLFPEIGGGSGLGIGKERTEAMVQSFGGRVSHPLFKFRNNDLVEISIRLLN
jgi:hypothetical protein